MKQLVTLLILIINNLSICGQAGTLKPLKIDKTALSGVGLKKIELKDEPTKDFYQKMLFNGSEIMVFVVSTETWNNKIDNYGFDEYVYLLHGQSIVKPKNGVSKIFDYGDHFFIPKNFEGSWEISSGENLHYELSVISKKRTDSTYISKNKNYTEVVRANLSGSQIPKIINNEIYQEVLRDGVELKLSLKAEKPQYRSMEISTKEKLIHILSGLVKLTDNDNEEHIFYTGDFFIIPIGLEFNWSSEGHGIVKYLVVEKSDN